MKFEFIDYFNQFVLDHYENASRLARLAYDMDVRLEVENGEERFDVTKHMLDFRKNYKKLSKIAIDNRSEKGGRTILMVGGHDLFSLALDCLGNHWITLEFMNGKSKDFFTQMGPEVTVARDRLFEQFSLADLEDLMDICAEFLAGRSETGFTYELIAENKPFLNGVLDHEIFRLQVLDILVWIKTFLFLVKGRNFFKIKLRNPFDLLKLFDSMRGGLRTIAICFSRAGLQIRAGALKTTFFRAGCDVKPQFTRSFGPIQVRLDALFKLFSSVISH